MIWLALILGAVVLDWIVGDPRNIPHPIVWIGKLIGALTKKLNVGADGRARKVRGLVMWVLVIAITGAVTVLVQWVAFKIHLVVFLIAALWFLGTTLAEKSLRQSVTAVMDALKADDIKEARKQVGWLCGRDTTQLSEHEIIRATIETTAENTSDGIIAPLFYMIVGVIVSRFVCWLNPLTLAMCYKAVNTMDSMVGYIQEPYTDFGFFPANLDDVFNFIPARLTAILMLIAGGLHGYDFKNGCRIYKRDHANHKSPNAGHPESATAGLLDIQIGGTNVYFGQTVVKPTMGDVKHDLHFKDIADSLTIMTGAELVLMACVAAGLVILGLTIFA